MILVTIQAPPDLQLARALLAALAGQFEFYLLFASPELSQRFGPPPCAHGVDAALCVLNPQNFELVVSFSGSREPRHAWSLRLLSFFDEVGIETLEIQHTLFQHGIDAEHPSGLALGFAARNVLAWGGDDGVGYLKSELPPAAASTWGESFVLVTSGDAARAGSGDHHHRFAIAVLKLAASMPAVRFVWAAEEDADPEASAALSLVQDYRLANLGVERSLPAESLVSRCSAGICMLSSLLIDLQLQHKPVLLYACDQVARLCSRLQAQSFANESDLQRDFRLLQAEPARFLVQTSIERLSVQRLSSSLRAAIAGSTLRPGWLPIALRAWPELVPASADERRSEAYELVSHQLQRVLERLGVLQRSTLSYKAKKLAAALRKET